MRHKLLAAENFPSRRGDGLIKVRSAEPEFFDDGSRLVRFCFSDGSLDRMGDRVNPNGWDISDFMANPVTLWAHDAASPPIGRARNVGPEAGRLMGDIEFAGPDVYPFADTIYRLVRGGFIRAVSVGFLPVEYSFVENDPDRPGGIDFKRQQLLEISVCPVPANANALIEARAAGIDLRPLSSWAGKAIHLGNVLLAPAELQAIQHPSARRQRDLEKALRWRGRVAETRKPRASDWAADYDATLANYRREAAEAQQRRDRAAVIDAALRLAAWVP